MTKIIVVDERRCLGCRSCELACAMAHCAAGTLVEALGAEIAPQSRVHVEPVGDHGMPLQCRHCEDAPCVRVCPTEAICYGPDGGPPVLLDRQRCIGCRACLLVCPFGVIEEARDGKAMIKCDLCVERTKAGELPACVSACPTRAIQFVELDGLVRRRRREAANQAAAGAERGKEGTGKDRWT